MSEEIKYREEWQYPTNIILNLTDDCNLACRYCFVQQKPNYMTWDTAKDIIHWLVNNQKIKKEKNLKINENGKEKIHLAFFGGEPMLMYEKIIQPFFQYVNENFKDLFEFTITTNGTLLNEEKIKTLYDNNCTVLLSIDGDETTQNYNRPCRDKNLKSFDLLKNNIPILLKYFPSTNFRCTIYEPTVSNLFNNYLFAESSGFRHIFFTPDLRHGRWSKENIQILEEQIKLIGNYRLNQYLNGIKPLKYGRFDQLYNQIFYDDIGQNNKKVNVFRCGLGTTSISINYKGELFTCQEQDSRLNGNDIFYIGDIYTGINKEKHLKLLNSFKDIENRKCENPQLCENCKLNNFCLSCNCPSTYYDIFHNFNTVPELFCIFNKIVCKVALANMKVLVENNNLMFKKSLFNILRYKNYNNEKVE